uniref:Fibronectin type-III domain-containing protein n=1 Tax=Angiostrongylus costaricensis TaxID=334426 RepID=A0A0R3PV29_ANGCS
LKVSQLLGRKLDCKRRRKLSHSCNTEIGLLFILSAQQVSADRTSHTSPLPEQRCGTLDIRNHPNQGYKLAGHKYLYGNRIFRNCSVLEGSLVLSLIQNSNVTEADFPTFHYLREITGSLLIFHVRSLTTLSRIFPNLRIVGGQNLIQHFSLIIYQNEDLIDIGLSKLRLIRNGGVRIAENNKMCYSRYIDWKHLMAGPLNDILVDDAVEIGVGEGKILSCTDDCEVENESKCRRVSHQRGEQLSCWNKVTCQEDCPFDRINGSIGPGCADSNGARCHDQCVAGCTVPDDEKACYGCLHYNHDVSFLSCKRCFSGLNMIIGRLLKPLQCTCRCWNLLISVIEGYLEIEMRVGMSTVAASQLTDCITASGSYRFAHVNFRYALSIFENSNLQKLFTPENRLTIGNGSVQFQNNRMLCYFRIRELMIRLGRDYYSNGDKAICKSIFKFISCAVSQTAFTLRWPALDTSDIDHRKFLGYDVSELKSSFGRREMLNTCILQRRFRCLVEHPCYFHRHDMSIFTTLIYRYAAYVTTKMVRHQGARNAVSNIAFVRTRFAVPDPPRITKAENFRLEWDPPAQPNGDISHYVVSWRAMSDAYMNQHMGAAVCHDGEEF